MPRKGVPDRWLDYSNYGKQIPRTNFIAFKVPLNQNICGRLPDSEQWTLTKLFTDIPELGMVIDLTNTTRYYDPEILRRNNVQHVKIACQGRGRLPPTHTMDKFFEAVDVFSARKSGQLVGVHCTHGLNRTGFFVCRYMIDRLGFTPQDAVESFNAARGHPIERFEYLAALTRDNQPPQLKLVPSPTATEPMVQHPKSGRNAVNHRADHSSNQYASYSSEIKTSRYGFSRTPPTEPMVQYPKSGRNGVNHRADLSSNQDSSCSSQISPSSYASRILYSENTSQNISPRLQLVHHGRDNVYPHSYQEIGASAQKSNFSNTWAPYKSTHSPFSSEHRESVSETWDSKSTGYSSRFDQPNITVSRGSSQYYSGEQNNETNTQHAITHKTWTHFGTPSSAEHGSQKVTSYSLRTQADISAGEPYRGPSQSYMNHHHDSRLNTNSNSYFGYTRNPESDFPNGVVPSMQNRNFGNDCTSYPSRSEESPDQVRRGNSGYYRRPYRPLRRPYQQGN